MDGKKDIFLSDLGLYLRSESDMLSFWLHYQDQVSAYLRMRACFSNLWYGFEFLSSNTAVGRKFMTTKSLICLQINIVMEVAVFILKWSIYTSALGSGLNNTRPEKIFCVNAENRLLCCVSVYAENVRCKLPQLVLL